MLNLARLELILSTDSKSMKFPKITQYACAVLLIVSSIALAFIQVIFIDDVATGVLMYIAQAFLLAGSIFGLDDYVRLKSKLPGQTR